MSAAEFLPDRSECGCGVRTSAGSSTHGSAESRAKRPLDKEESLCCARRPFSIRFRCARARARTLQGGARFGGFASPWK